MSDANAKLKRSLEFSEGKLKDLENERQRFVGASTDGGR